MITMSDYKSGLVGLLTSVCDNVLSRMCSHSHTNTHTPERRQATGGLLGRSQHRGRWEDCAPRRCERETEENKEPQPLELPPRPSELLSFVRPGRHLFGFANILIHRNSGRGRGWGLGRLAAVVCLHPGRLQPPVVATAF